VAAPDDDDMVHTVPFRLVALLLAAVLMAVVGAPAPANAMDPTTILAIAGAAAAGVVLVAYLVVANSEGDKGGAGSSQRVLWMACSSEEGCSPIPEETASALMRQSADGASTVDGASAADGVSTAAKTEGP
jgi:hypothetical protein